MNSVSQFLERVPVLTTRYPGPEVDLSGRSHRSGKWLCGVTEKDRDAEKFDRFILG